MLPGSVWHGPQLARKVEAWRLDSRVWLTTKADCQSSRHLFVILVGYVDGTVRQCRLEELLSPIEVPTDSSRVMPSPVDIPADSSRVDNAGPSATDTDADVGTRRPASKVGSRSSQASLLRRAALNEVRRAFFTSDSKTSVKDVEERVQTSPSQEFIQPIAGRLLLIL